MAKNDFLSWDTTPANNADLGGIGILGSNAVKNFDDAFRTLMAQLRRDIDNGVVYAVKTTNYTAVANDNNAVHRFTAAATLSLTAAETLGADWHYTIIADGADVTIDPNGAETINGVATIIIANGSSAKIICNGSAFFTDKDLSNEQPFATIASAATTNLALSGSQNVIITGTTTITSFGTLPAGVLRRLRFSSALTLTHNATSLILPNGGSNISISGGDTIEAVSLGSGNWVVMDWQVATPDGWGSYPVGVPVPVMTHKGVSGPPTNKGYRYVKLTAADSYNTGVITSESVSGTAPLLVATGVVSLTDSPMDGQTINLWNSEGRIPRPGSSAGTLQNDAFQDHAHGTIGSDGSGGGVAIINNAAGGFSPNNKTASGTTAATGGTPRTANETRMKNEAVTYYMRIK
ncbi:hypothetical protein [Rhizobium hidalgonense]|uniref:hypothetical protein n=1 Tax=Rhizobium hidalgonense TaxID=1538159 RepID=UPI002871CEB8|nr:hypothetical protein [Rhizobium hidalgonense]MDR9808213.1 hypothetical protein [Rhizobium hidalgonense]